jgi:glycosyltransferase involved in cell wall biosynthesis
MKILFGVPDITHRELVNLEIEGINALIPDCQIIHYGPVNSKRGFINKTLITISSAFAIRSALKKGNYDLLFLNTAFDFTAILRDCFTLFVIRRQKARFFLKFHGADIVLLDNLTGYKKILVNWLIKTAHGAGVLSGMEKDAFLRRGFPEAKIFIVKNPVDPSIYKQDADFKTKRGLDNSTFVFFFCARFLPFKGLMDVLEAMRIIKEKFNNIHLFCLGDGPEMTKAQLFVKNNDLSSVVTFTGFIAETETRTYYSNSDAMVFPSSHEGFPMAVFQSLAAGIPIITTRISASADYLNEPDNVLWVEHGYPGQLVSAMERLLTDPGLVQRMRNNNFLKGGQFTTDRNALEYKGIFEKVIEDNQFIVN